MKQVPLILQSALLNRWHCVTKYKRRADGTIEAKERFDIHDQVLAIIKRNKKKAKVK